MAENKIMVKQIIDDIALNKYDSIEEAIDDLVYYGVNPLVARTTVLTMDTIDVVP
jgi:hypothetical protein